MTCRWDRDAADYLTDDGEPCRVDDYGDPTHHCTARRTCAQHVGAGELTCARCVGRTRADLRRIRDLTPLMLTVALATGVDSEAANLSGPAADPEAWVWRKVAARQGRAWHVSLIEDDDDLHPHLLLGRWDMMIREDYDHPSDQPVTISNAAAYLDAQLHRIAQDDAQDWPLLARELRRCRTHLETVMSDSRAPERGAPCRSCPAPAPRLRLVHGHWCDDAECCRFHHADDTDDEWVCPRDRSHRWGVEDYRRWVYADAHAARVAASAGE